VTNPQRAVRLARAITAPDGGLADISLTVAVWTIIIAEEIGTLDLSIPAWRALVPMAKARMGAEVRGYPWPPFTTNDGDEMLAALRHLRGLAIGFGDS